MPTESRISIISDRGTKEYLVVYRDDPPERVEAIHFFQTHHPACLFPGMPFPAELEDMPLEEANAYLREHPCEKQWSSLTIGPEYLIVDDDLARLRYLPELDHVTILSSRITDAGVKHLLFLKSLTRLTLSSSRVTDDCLQDIQTMRSLASLDMQSASGVSREAFLHTIVTMPWLQDVHPPPDYASTTECHRRGRLARTAPPEALQANAVSTLRLLGEPLGYVNLSGQRMSQPPDDLFRTDNLGRLDLIHCGIETLPEAIGNLTRLRMLYVGGGQLTELPDTFGRLAALENLWLNHNRLHTLPHSFRCLQSLKTLDLTGNRLEQFPEGVLSLNQLEELQLPGNGLSALPDEIGQLTALRTLHLGRNKLESVPRGIGKLQSLTYLDLARNPLRSLPDEVWELPCLTALNLTKTGITELPPAAGRIPEVWGPPIQRVASLDPNWLTWRDGAVVRLARAIAEKKDFAALPVLADALEEAGCADPKILGHCRSPGWYTRHSWVVDRILSATGAS